MTVIHLPNLSANDSLHEMGLPVDAPFTCAQARDSGVARRTLEDLVRRRVLRRPIRGVYLAADIEDCLTSRVACLRLVMPPDCFAADETAAWLYAGSTALGPNADLAPPRAVFFRPRDGGRLRNGLCVSGERSVLPVDLVEVHGLVTPTPLRTALDLGRLRKRDQAMWAWISCSSNRRSSTPSSCTACLDFAVPGAWSSCARWRLSLIRARHRSVNPPSGCGGTTPDCPDLALRSRSSMTVSPTPTSILAVSGFASQPSTTGPPGTPGTMPEPTPCGAIASGYAMGT